jgi:hypothetical protein
MVFHIINPLCGVCLKNWHCLIIQFVTNLSEKWMIFSYKEERIFHASNKPENYRLSIDKQKWQNYHIKFYNSTIKGLHYRFSILFATLLYVMARRSCVGFKKMIKENLWLKIVIKLLVVFAVVVGISLKTMSLVVYLIFLVERK